ncbi:MAG: hypothetical protein IH848_06635, partial [Acidobacteria bacterium]|nr:hypothetical protein [Acidobacteriota bacterium]
AANPPFEIDKSNIALVEPVEEPGALTVEPLPPAEAEEDEQAEPGATRSSDPEFDAVGGPDFTDQPDTSHTEASTTESPQEVLLTQAADDHELFDDPNLDVAGIAPGEEREIVIPVEIGAAGQTKRFKLSVRLRLDPVDD